MLLSSFCASRLSDATRRMSATELVLRSSVAAATPSQQQLRRSSSSVAAAAPSQHHYNLALKWSSHRRVPPRGAAGRDAAAPRGGTRRHLEEGHELLLPRSISSVAAALAPSQQRATAASRDDERSTGAFLLRNCASTITRSVVMDNFTAYFEDGKSWVSLSHSPCGEKRFFRACGLVTHRIIRVVKRFSLKELFRFNAQKL